MKLAPTPGRIIWRRGPVRLLRYESPRSGPTHPIPVLLVPSIINRAYILDLQEGQSFAAHLVDAGFSVCLLDWGVPGTAQRTWGLRKYALELLGRAIREIGRTSPGVHLFGYCLGGTFSLLAGAAEVPGIETIAALAAPVDLSEPGALGRLTGEKFLDLDGLSRAFPIVPGEMLWSAFQTLDPVGIQKKWRGIARRSSDERFLRRVAAQETWLADPVPVTARVLREIVSGLYRENRLVRGGLHLDGETIRLGDGRVPVLNLVADRDGIVPPDASIPLDQHWGGRVETHRIRGGHIGITIGSKAPERMWARAVTWFGEHQPVST